MTDIAKLGLDIDSTSAKTAATELSRLEASAKELGVAVDRLSPTVDKFNTTINKSASGMKAAKKGVDDLKDSAGKINPTLNKFEKELAAIEKQAQRFGIGIGAAIAAAIAAFVALTAAVIKNDAALDDMAEMTGASVESLSALKNVAFVSGQNFERVRAAMGNLSQTLSTVDDESKAAAVALREIGLSVEEIRAMSPDQQMLRIAKALDQFEDSGSKAAIVQALYKRGAQELLPFLKDLSREGTLITTVTAQQAAQAEELQKAYNRITLGLQEMFAGPVRELAPLFTEIADAMKVSIDNADDAYDSFSPLLETLSIVAVLGANVAFVFKRIGVEIGGMLAQIGALNDIASMGPIAVFTEKGQEAFRRFKSIGEQMKADAEIARKEFDALEFRLMNAEKLGQFREGNKYFVGPSRPKGNLNFNAHAGKQTDEENRLDSILSTSHTGLQQQLEKDIALVHEWAQADDSRTLRAVEAVNMLIDAYEKAAGIADEREKNRKAGLDKEDAELKASIARWEQLADVENEAAKQMEENDKAATKRSEQIKDFNRELGDHIDQIHLEGKAYGQTELEREMAIEARKLEAEYTKAQIGLNEGELITLKAIYEERKRQLADAVGDKVHGKTIEEKLKAEAEAAQKIVDNFIETIQTKFGDELYNIIDGNFKSIGDSFLNMIKRMLADALAAKLTKALFGDGSGGGLNLVSLGLKALSAFSGPTDVSPAYGARGAVFAGGMSYFANGGIVDSPTAFKFAHGGEMRNGIMGEAGPEAIIPLKRGSDGRLGVAGGMTINNVTNVSIDSRADRNEVQMLVERGVERGNAKLVEKLQRSGAI